MSTHSSRSIKHLLHVASTFPIHSRGCEEPLRGSSRAMLRSCRLGCREPGWNVAHEAGQELLAHPVIPAAFSVSFLLPACPETCSLSLVSSVLVHTQLLFWLWLLPLQPYSLLRQELKVLKCFMKILLQEQESCS